MVFYSFDGREDNIHYSGNMQIMRIWTDLLEYIPNFCAMDIEGESAASPMIAVPVGIGDWTQNSNYNLDM